MNDWGGTVSPEQGTLSKVQDLSPCPVELLPQSQDYYSAYNICSQLFHAKASSSALDALKQIKRYHDIHTSVSFIHP